MKAGFSQGFSMMELLVVLTIMGLLMSFVAPLAMKEIDKSTARTELLEAKNWLVSTTTHAYLQQKNFSVKLEDNKAELYHGAVLIESRQFNSVSFPEQMLLINRFGIANPAQITGHFMESSIVIEVSQSD